ncbi:MAG: hypothetical protein FJ214_06495 [Ignavibacteria bacterium]|nr:hypothetical protein [Ignavibacteria bacterium]
MKDKIVILFLLVALISLLIGLIGKISATNLYFANSTWHAFAQTSLLFAIAWSLGKSSVSK